ncbi:MAG: zinc-ribbon domain-containing protein [Proteobacteria bacterium]|nr:zinc-ribbon domain-containing protein [Pseudomonadota bacterium]
MHIVCDQCQAKYVVPDEKIEKNILRFTCQKCGNVITQRVDDAKSEPPSPASTLNKWRTSIPNTPRKLQSELPKWYYSINGESIGPFTEQELKTRLLSDKLAESLGQCFVWCKTFTDWKPVLEVEPFASALTSPVPPPPPAPAPVPLPKTDGPLPPLFKESSEHPGLSSILNKPKSSPDLPGLKQRLQKGSSTQLAAQQREALAKLAGVSLETIKPPDISSPEDQLTDEDETRAHAPLLADIIPPTQTADTDTASETSKTLPKPHNSLPPIGSKTGGIKPLGGLQSGPRPSGIMPLSGGLNPPQSQSKLGGIPKPIPSSADNKVLSLSPKSGQFKTLPSSADNKVLSLPPKSGQFKTLPSSANNKALDIPSGLQKPLPSSANNKALDISSGLQKPLPSSANNKALDFGSIPKAAPISKPQVQSVSARSSVTDLPSLDIALDEPSELNSTSSDILPDIDLDDAASPMISKTAGSLTPVQAPSQDASEELPLDLDLENSELISKSSVNEAISESGEYRSADDQHLLSSAQVLSMMHKSKASVSPVSAENPTSADLAEIDLDEDNSQFIASEEIKEITNDSNAPKISGIMNADALFGDTASEPVVARARASQNKLEEIAAKHADLFAELEAAEPEPEPDENGVSEHSMLIQLEHFNKVQQKEKTKRNVKLIAAIAGTAALLLIIAAISGIVISNKQDTEESTKTAQNTPSLKVAGRDITLDEVDVTIPEDDFEIIPAQPEKNTRTQRRSQNAQADGAKAEDVKSATDAASEAIYGEKTDTPSAAQNAVRSDGRAGVVLAKSDEFGSTAGVQGSKKTKSASSSSREKLLAGLKTVSKSVQNCSQRAAKQGITLPEKIYINLTVQPSGSVETYEIDTTNVPDIFNKCLESKKDTWRFEPFDGDAIRFKQSFILG